MNRLYDKPFVIGRRLQGKRNELRKFGINCDGLSVPSPATCPLAFTREIAARRVERSGRTSAKSVAVNVNPGRNSICIQRRRKLVYFVIGFVRFILPRRAAAKRSARAVSIILADSRTLVHRLREREERRVASDQGWKERATVNRSESRYLRERYAGSR